MRRRGTALLLLAAGTLGLARAAWIPAKAELAQLMLARAWAHSQARGVPVAPWPWADTDPVARLTAPRLGVERLVLAGAHGRSLAFGPGHWSGSASPGNAGNVVIAGHRDTHFAFLQHLALGDLLWLEARSGERSAYRVAYADVAHESDSAPMEPVGRAVLTLITCYPFDAVVPGGPLRYVVRAVRQGDVPDCLTSESSDECAARSETVRNVPLSQSPRFSSIGGIFDSR